jgi:hypothetical protein
VREVSDILLPAASHEVDFDPKARRQYAIQVRRMGTKPLDGLAGTGGDLQEYIVIGGVGLITTHAAAKSLAHRPGPCLLVKSHSHWPLSTLFLTYLSVASLSTVVAGCHCATLAHHAFGLTPPASCRLSFYLYNTPDEVDRAVDAVAAIAAQRSPALL